MYLQSKSQMCRGPKIELDDVGHRPGQDSSKSNRVLRQIDVKKSVLWI